MLIIQQIFIKDVKSSNGTFINGDRLSPEGLESDPFELKSDDIVVRMFPAPVLESLFLNFACLFRNLALISLGTTTRPSYITRSLHESSAYSTSKMSRSRLVQNNTNSHNSIKGHLVLAPRLLSWPSLAPVQITPTAPDLSILPPANNVGPK